MSISPHLREAMRLRFPTTNFDLYFSFLELLPEELDGHRHHILPKKQFPMFAKDVSNITKISPADHLKAHYYLALCAPDYEPFQIMFYLMAGNRRAYKMTGEELLEYAEVYGRSCVLWKARRILVQTGVPLSEEHRTSLRAAWVKRKEKGLLRSRKSYEAQGVKTKGRKQTQEWVSKRAIKLKGRTLSENQKRQISKTLQGRPASVGTAQNLRKIAAGRSQELTAWLGRKGAAKRWDKEFSEPRPD